MLIAVGDQETFPATEQSGPFPKPFGITDGHSLLKERCSGWVVGVWMTMEQDL